MPNFEEEPKRPEPKEIWLISYADLVTLMLAFFILLYSFSTLNAKKFQAVAESFKPTPPGTPYFFSGQDSALQSLVSQLQSSELADDTLITVDSRGVVVSFKSAALFHSGTADLTGSARQRLDKLVALITGLPNRVLIEGHTDDQPVRGGVYPSNWELSAARAGAVARLFEQDGVKGQRLEVIGYGQFRPRFRNDSPEKRALNRRIDVVIRPD